MQEPIQMLHELARSSSSRENFWQRFVNEQNVRQMLVSWFSGNWTLQHGLRC